MPQQLLTLRSLHLLGDGTLDTDFTATLAAAARDCVERAGIDKTREVKIVFTLRPVIAANGSCDDVEVDVQVASKSPAKQVPTYTMTCTKNGGLKFQPDSPGDPRQEGMFDQGDTGGKG